MNYKTKLLASQDRALRQLIATKIEREMSELRSQVESSPTARRRWVWELIQNARDVHQDGSVNIQIELDESNRMLVFRHSGLPFTADNIRFLIEQISTKERTKDSTGLRTTSGKFGTGFLATHLLSETVLVQGVAKEPELDFKQFQFELDRSGYDLDEIAASVQKAKQAVENLDELNVYAQYDPCALNTAFHYSLVDDIGLRVAKTGLDDLHCCLPYVFAFVSEIDTVDVPFQTRSYSKHLVREWTESEYGDDAFCVLTRVQVANPTLYQQQNSDLHILTISRGYTSVSIPVEVKGDTLSIKPISDQTPRLFCDFPLVGTETFPFPAVINNPHFDPTNPRDGILLTGQDRITPLVENNRQIIADGVELLLQLIDIAIANKWEHLYQFATIHPLRVTLPWVSSDWFMEQVVKPIRNKILHAPIVETAANSLVSMVNEDNTIRVWFPSGASKGMREEIWSLAEDWFSHVLPKKHQVEIWHDIIWKECGQLTPKQFAEFVEHTGSIAGLTKELLWVDSMAWLNDFYSMLESDKDNYDTIINNKRLFPNQNGEFRRIAVLSADNGDIGDPFKDILKLLGSDLREELIAESLNSKIQNDKLFCQKDVVNQISLLAFEKVNNREEAKAYHGAFRTILEWFRTNPALAMQLFPALYRDKHLLYDDDSIMESMHKADQLDQLLSEIGVSNIDELKLLLVEKESGEQRELLPITQEILASLGISSVEDWQKALQEKDIAAMFSHESVPTTEMFMYAQSLIGIAKQRIIEHLTTLPEYDVSRVEETAPTVLGGITKEGRDIQIVARPGNSGKVIIYYSAELDILDFEESELWVNTGTRQMKVTLGHILKKSGIKKFPI